MAMLIYKIIFFFFLHINSFGFSDLYRDNNRENLNRSLIICQNNKDLKRKQERDPHVTCCTK